MTLDIKECDRIKPDTIALLNAGREDNPFVVKVGVLDATDRFQLGLSRDAPPPPVLPETDDTLSAGFVSRVFGKENLPHPVLIGSWFQKRKSLRHH